MSQQNLPVIGELVHIPAAGEGVTCRTVPAFSGYAAGDDGTVWTNKYHGRATSVWKQRKPQVDKAGYLKVQIRVSGKMLTTGVHRMVLLAFKGPCPEGMECRHFPDRNPSNNRPCNLQWGTPLENSADRTYHGSFDPEKGEDRYNALLTEKSVLQICDDYSSGESSNDLAARFGVSLPLIHAVISGRAWKHVTRELKPRRKSGSRGVRHPRCKLTEEDVRAIRVRCDSGEKLADIAIDYSVNVSCVQAIGARRSWKCLT